MFSDPFTAVMALILLAFIGTLAVFLRIWRELETVKSSLKDIRESLQFYAVDAAQQNRDLAAIIRELRGLSVSREEPTEAAETCLGELLERGLPNLETQTAGNAAFAESAELGKSGRIDFGDDDEDLIRRLGNGLGTDTDQK